jgi:hypothetical protein
VTSLAQPIRLATALAVVFTIACTDPLALSAIQLGRSLNIDNTVGSPTSTFTPHETVYVSIKTTARGKGTVGVRWKYRDQVVDEPSKQVNTDGTKAIEFHLVNAGGFPIGDYSVDLLIDGQVVGTRAFKVDNK